MDNQAIIIIIIAALFLIDVGIIRLYFDYRKKVGKDNLKSNILLTCSILISVVILNMLDILQFGFWTAAAGTVGICAMALGIALFIRRL